jgi:membrane dipeptidase
MSEYDEALLKRARALHDAPNVTMDGHNDLPWALHDAYDHRLARFDLREPQGHIKIPKLRHQYLHTDFPRCRKGGLTAQFWSVYVPTTIRGGEAVQKTLEQIDCVHRLCEKYPDHLEFAYTAADVRRSAQIMLDGVRPTHWLIRAQVRRIVKDGKLASMAGLEGGHQINGSLATLRMYYRLGCRYLTLTHNGGPGWADAALDENSKWNEHAKAGGLSRFGEEVVKEMNRLGMAVDLSHVHPDTMRKAIAVSEAPVLFSHSNTRAVCNHPRNVPDDVLRSLSEKDGVVMINVNAPFVAGDFFVSGGKVGASVIQVADHIDYAKKVCGNVLHLGLGADYDGIKAPARGMEDVSTYPILTAELLKRGYTDDEIIAINGGNVLRCLEKIEAVAARLQASSLASEAKPEDFGEVAG